MNRIVQALELQGQSKLCNFKLDKQYSGCGRGKQVLKKSKTDLRWFQTTNHRFIQFQKKSLLKIVLRQDPSTFKKLLYFKKINEK